MTRDIVQSKGGLTRDEAIQQNQGLVRKFAKQYLRPGIDFLDLVQEGQLALLWAWELYDPTKAKFITYAYSWIRVRMQSFVAAFTTPVKLPPGTRAGILDDVTANTATHRFAPEIEMGELENHECRVIPAQTEWTPEYLDVQKVMAVIECLSHREQQVFLEHYFNDAYFADIAVTMDVSRERIRVIHEQVLEKVRRRLRVANH